MLGQLLASSLLMSVNVATHAAGTAVLLRWLLSLPRRRKLGPPAGVVRATIVLVRTVLALVLLHLLEAATWATFYSRWRLLPDFEAALYFSIVSYTTIGYGDVVLPDAWRLLGALEGMTGVLMFGWSTGFLFGVVRAAWAPDTETHR